MEYNHKEIEESARRFWRDADIYKVAIDASRPKYYVLDMSPTPRGRLHVGHPLGYIASDIYARYKRQKGFNVLHPMGFDAYGLPAEQYAIQTGQHPEITTRQNIERYCKQLEKIGFSFDWSRSIRTCDPNSTVWTQWAFLKMFNSWYDRNANSARPIAELEEHLAQYGTEGLDAACTKEMVLPAEDWANMDAKGKKRCTYELASGISCQRCGELVPKTGNCAGQRRSQRRPVGAWRILRRTEKCGSGVCVRRIRTAPPRRTRPY